jgi:hypothetical protein
MSQIQIGQGPGNLVPDSEQRQFLAAAAIGRGQVVTLDIGASGIAKGYTVEPADSDGTNLDLVVGVAAEDIASGAWGNVVVSGYCAYVLTDGSVAIGDPLVPHTVAGEASTMAAGEEHLVFGMALSTDTGTTEYSDAIIFKRV